jgi:DNA-3-methyladenine glycosylase II
VASFTKGATALGGRDPALDSVIAASGKPRLPRSHGSHFEALVESVTHQQLAGKAARTIHGRLVALVDGEVTPERILALSPEQLRGAGLSGNKAASIVDLAAKVLDGTADLSGRRLSDEEIVTRLTMVRGIGPWTAEMFLIFQLRRPDVWPTGDFGVRRGYGLMHAVAMPTARELEPLGDPYRPYRSVAAWYCWRACDLLG